MNSKNDWNIAVVLYTNKSWKQVMREDGEGLRRKANLFGVWTSIDGREKMASHRDFAPLLLRKSKGKGGALLCSLGTYFILSFLSMGDLFWIEIETGGVPRSSEY